MSWGYSHRTIGYDNLSPSGRTLKIGHGHAILSTFLWISGGVRVNDVRQVQCHGLSRANEAIPQWVSLPIRLQLADTTGHPRNGFSKSQEGSQQNLWHGGNLRQCRRGRIVTGHWQHRYIIHQGQQDHLGSLGGTINHPNPPAARGQEVFRYSPEWWRKGEEKEVIGSV